MSRRVRRKQHNSAMCLVCGLRNPLGLRGSFFELDTGELLGTFRPREEHQGYPGRLHGGIAAAILDETIGRAVMLGESRQIWGVSLELSTRFRKPVPLGGELRVLARITRNGRRFFEGSGEILLAGGETAVEGRGRYLKMPLEKISDPGLADQWKVVPSEDDPEEFDL